MTMAAAGDHFYAEGLRAAAMASGAPILAGATLERWSLFRAGFQSVRDPKYTVMPQRGRLKDRGASE